MAGLLSPASGKRFPFNTRYWHKLWNNSLTSRLLNSTKLSRTTRLSEPVCLPWKIIRHNLRHTALPLPSDNQFFFTTAFTFKIDHYSCWKRLLLFSLIFRAWDRAFRFLLITFTVNKLACIAALGRTVACTSYPFLFLSLHHRPCPKQGIVDHHLVLSTLHEFGLRQVVRISSGLIWISIYFHFYWVWS
jgi:hypothetical protein